MRTVLLMALGWCVAAMAAEELVLADQGDSRAVVISARDADKLERQAAAELADYLGRLGGQPPRSVAVPPADLAAALAEARQGGAVPLVMGSLALPELGPLLETAGSDPGAFALVVDATGVRLAGRTPEATGYAVAELLEQLGVRWFFPGELGTAVPPAGRVALAAQRTVQAPAFPGRSVSGTGPEWARHNRLGGVTPPSALDFPAPAPFAEHPEYYALVNGQRQPTQLCLTHPAVLPALVAHARAYFAKQPAAIWLAVSNHGGGHCECAACRALDPPVTANGLDFTGGRNVSDRYIQFCNRLLDALAAEFPDRRLAFTMATPDFLPPVAVRGHARLDVIGWSVGFCRLHGVGNPRCADRALAHQLMGGWVRQLDGRYYERGEWGHVACPGLPYPAVQRYRAELPALHALGVAGIRNADYGHWIAQLPADYLAARLLWQPRAEVDALLADFYTRFYGPAATPMRAYHELLEATLRDADHHTGTALDFPAIYPAAVRAAARGHLDQARRLVPDESDPFRNAQIRLLGLDEPYAARLAALARELDYLDAFCAMMEARNRHDYAAAYAALEQARAQVASLIGDLRPPLLGKSFARPYLDLFFGRAVEEAHHLTSDRGTLVAGLADTWEFHFQPRLAEETRDWRLPAADTPWRPLAAWSSSWSNQGLHNRAGDAWYRQTFALPATATGPLRLWCGAIDEAARLWLNGQPLGDAPGGAWQSFSLDATTAARPGQPNTLVIHVRNWTMDEIGTGGLLAPVFLYAPRGE
jgi:hypothetical protein